MNPTIEEYDFLEIAGSSKPDPDNDEQVVGSSPEIFLVELSKPTHKYVNKLLVIVNSSGFHIYYHV
jgi:hypothetical protein